MIEYHFYNRNNELACEVTNDNVTCFLDMKTAKRYLLRFSKNNFEDVSVDKTNAYFFSMSATLVIEDAFHLLNRYGAYGGLDFRKIIEEKFPNAIKRVGKKSIKAHKKGLVKATCAAGVLIALLNSKIMPIFGEGKVADAESIEISLDHTLTEYPLVEKLAAEVDEVIEKNKTVTLLPPDEVKFNDFNYLDINCDEKGYSSDVEYVVMNYGDIIDEISGTYGIAPKLLVALLTHESHGVHENLMQIIFEAHSKNGVDEVKKAYNVDKGDFEYFVLTENPGAYKGKGYTIYTKEDLTDPYKNIKCGAAIFASYYQKYCKNNICAAIICYNQGPGTLNTVLAKAASKQNITVDDILLNPTDITFIDEVRKLTSGDPYYLEHVMQYVTDSEDGIYMTNVDGSDIYFNTLCVSKEKNIVK